MRSPLHGLARLACALPLILHYGLRAVAGTPVVGQTMDPSCGGCQMIVAGEGFVAGKTKFRLWSPEWKADFAQKDETKRLLACLESPPPPLPEKPGAAFVDCQVIRCTEPLAAVEFPQYGPWSGPRTSSYFAVLYAGSDQDGWSKPWAFNRTEAHMLDRDAAAPGDFVRIFGRKLQAMHAPLPVIALVPRAGGKPIPCPTQDIYYQHQHYIGNYSCQFLVPAETPEGSYLVRAHNHTGEAWGWSEPLTLEVRKPPPEPKRFDVRDFGAKGDDAAAIQKVLDEAGRNAPAVVALPPGTFAISETLAIPPGVTLRGSGVWNTTILPSQAPPFRGEHKPIEGMAELALQPTWQVFNVMLWGRTDFAIEDLAIEDSYDAKGLLLAIVNGRNGVAQNVALRRCRFQGSLPEAGKEKLEAARRADGLVATRYFNGLFIGRARRLTIDHCTLSNAGLWAFENRDAYLGFSGLYASRCIGGASLIGAQRWDNVVVEHNKLTHPSGAVIPGGVRNLLVAGNTAREAEGEALAVAGADVRWSGPARCPDASTVVTPGANWRLANLSFDGLDTSSRERLVEGLSRDLTGCIVAVTAGKGIGQWRDVASASGEAIRLAQPFAVAPDESSRVCVMRGSVANTLVCGIAEKCSGTAGGFIGAGAINGIIEGIQAVGTGPPQVRSRPGGAPDLYNQIVHCRLFAGEGIHLAASEGEGDAALQLGTVVARNEILGLKAGSAEGIRVEGPVRFAAIEGNRISGCEAAVSISPKSAGTLVRRNRMMGIERGPVLDQGIESIVAGYTDKAGFHDHWPQGLNVLQLFKGTPPKPEEKK